MNFDETCETSNGLWENSVWVLVEFVRILSWILMNKISWITMDYLVVYLMSISTSFNFHYSK